MKKKSGIVIVSGLHLILWAIILFASVIMKITFRDPGMEPLDLALSKGVYNVFVIIAAIGIINASVLFFSLCAILGRQDIGRKKIRIATLCIAAAATILFYLFAALIFVINKDILLVLPIVWLLFELCCGVLLIISKKGPKKGTRSQRVIPVKPGK